MGYVVIILYVKSAAARAWFELIATRSIGEPVVIDRLSLSLPRTVVAYKMRVGTYHIESLTMEMDLFELLGPTQTIVGKGELREGLAFRFDFKGSFWTEELRSLAVGIDQWPLPMVVNKLGLTKYLLAPPEQGRIKGVAFKKRDGWQFRGKIDDAALDLSRIAAGTQLPRSFPDRTRVVTNEIDIRYRHDEIRFNKPLHIKTRMGSLYLEGRLIKEKIWRWQARALIRDANAGRAGYGYLLRCAALPVTDAFKIEGPLQKPKCA
jgi:hypothetical protein